MSRKHKKRRNYFVNKQVQGLYAFFIIMSVGIISLLVGMEILRSFYYSYGSISEESFFSHIDMYFVFKVLSLLILGSVLIGGLSLFASHRIAGPIFRLNRSLKKLAKGRSEERLVFRKHDYFQEVAVNFNKVAEYFDDKINTDTKLIAELDAKVSDTIEQVKLMDTTKEDILLSLEELKTLIVTCQNVIKHAETK